MSPLLVFLLRMPVTLFVGGLELFLRSMREFQANYNESTDALIVGTGKLLNRELPWEQEHDSAPAAALQSASAQSGVSEPVQAESKLLAEPIQCTPPPSIRKEPEMSDWKSQDEFRNSKVKSISYRIRFAKRDFDATLQNTRSEEINYSTDAGNVKGDKKNDFFEKLRGGLPIPREWRGGNHPPGDYGYDDDDEPKTYSKIPQSDRHHVEVMLTLDDTRDKSESEYDREQTRAQQELANNIKRLADNI